MNKKYNRIISTFFTIVLLQIFMSNACASVPAGKAEKPQAGIYIFVSFTMNDKSLESYFREAQSCGAKLVMRGLAKDAEGQGSFAVTRSRVKKAKINVDINPHLFEQLGIKHVPVIAVVDKEGAIKKISGHISLEKALELMEVKTAVREK